MDHPQQFLLGMDGGATKSVVVVATLEGDMIDQLTLNALNVNGQPRENLTALFASLQQQLNARGYELASCAGICVGAAGISNQVAQQWILEALQEQGFFGEVLLVGDHQTALFGALRSVGQTEGAVLIAGTGSICYGVNQAGASFRAGGYGHLIDDVGSGYQIGIQILQAVVRGVDGRTPPTVLQRCVYEQLGCARIEDVVTWLYAPQRAKKEIAALAPLIEVGLSEQDPASLVIVAQSITQLKELAIAVLQHLSEQTTLVVSGSVLLQNKAIAAGVREQVKQWRAGVSVIPMQGEAAWGAIGLLLQQKRGNV